MSRTFDILERMHQDKELLEVPEIGKRASDSSRTTDKVSFPDLSSFASEELLKLVQHLFLAADDTGHASPKRVVFCEIDSIADFDLLCVRIGRLLASQVDSPVCVVDANVRRPHKNLFGATHSNSSVASNSENTIKHLLRVTDNLWFLSGDMLNVEGAASLEELVAAIVALPPEFAYVVIIAPPAGLYSDAAVLGQVANGVVLVLEANVTRRATARKAKEALEMAKVRILGTVLNNRTFPIPEALYRKI